MEEQKFKMLGAAVIGLLVLGVAVFVTQTPVETKDTDGPEPNSSQGAATQLLPEATNKTTIYLFWGDGCPHCAKEKPFLEDLEKEHDGLEVQMYEVYYDEKNQQMYKNVADIYGTSASGVPGTFIGQEYWRGYNEEIGNEIEAKAEECLENGCEDPIRNQ